MMESANRKKLGFFTFWVVESVLYAMVFVGAEFSGSPVGGLKGVVTLGAQWLVVSVAASAVLGLLTLSRRIYAVMFPLLLTASAVAAYYKLSMGLSLTPTLVELAVTNDLATWSTVMSPLLFIVMAVALGIGVGVAVLRWRRVESPRHRWLWGVAFMAAAVTPVWPLTRFKAPVVARMPYTFWYSVKEYMANRKAISEERDTFARTPAAVADGEAPEVVFVIGESLRPDHLQLNGYHRATTPLLAADTAVVSVPHMWTTPCYTHVSVPHIVTRADSLNPDRAFTEQSFITLFTRAGYRTAWLSNQDAVDSYAYFMHEADTLVQHNGARSLYGYDKWMDSEMLPDFDRLRRLPYPRRLTVMHTIGSHWWYPSHYPDSLARFKPEVDSRIVSELTREQLVNSYDNTILATDRFLASLIDRLRHDNAVMIFISDHGEALGEDGNMLHGADYPQLHVTACLVWCSPEFTRRYPDKVKALRRNASRQWNTDAMFHTVLDAAGIDTPVLNPQMSLFHDFDR